MMKIYFYGLSFIIVIATRNKLIVMDVKYFYEGHQVKNHF